MSGIRKVVILSLISALQGFASVQGQASRPSAGAEPTTVWFFLYVMDIDAIDGAGQNFTANVYVRLRWKDERLTRADKTINSVPLEEIWNPAVLLANQQGLVRTSLPELARVEPDGTVMYRQRYVGTLSQPLHLSEFPFDRHEFVIQFTSAGYGGEELVFMPEKVDGEELMVGGFMAEKLSLPDWQVIRYAAEARPFVITEDLQAPGFAFAFTAERHLNYYFWQAVIPLILIVLMSWGPFWIDPSLSGTQISLAASAMLTTIAYRFLLANLVPRLPYMTRMDYFTLLSTVLVFAALAEVVTTSSLSHANRGGLARKIDRGARLVFPILFVLALYWSFVV
ncbi:MAG: hypothetical protein ACYST6_07955 [Planctomycetota bacterium]|jgi:hypothetical protein